MDGKTTSLPSAIQQGIDAYQQWKVRLQGAVSDFERWLGENEAETGESASQIQECLGALRGDRLAVAAIASDAARAAVLINAALYPGHGRPLLPPDGALPACPITLYWDEVEERAFLRLLPRGAAATDAQAWVQHPLDTQTGEPYALSLQRVLGGTPGDGGWGQALISIPHPLLQQGLSVLLLPGLAGLEQDPQTTLPLLQRSQGVLVALDAESGMTGGDLAVWREQLQRAYARRREDVVVCLDRRALAPGAPGAPHDGDRPPEKRPEELRREFAEALELPGGQVVPISLGLGLAARLRQDAGLLQRSRVPELEHMLVKRVLEAKHREIVAILDEGIGALAQSHYAQMSGEIIQVQGQIQELEDFRARNDRVLEQLASQTRDQRGQYVDAVTRFQAFRTQLLADVEPCREALARPTIEALIEVCHQAMAKSWTTRGLSLAMKEFLDRLRAHMQAVTDESERHRKLVRKTYEDFLIHHGFELSAPRVFVPTRYHVELELLYQEAEDLRHSRAMAFVEQSHVIERFNQQIASRARVLFEQLRLNLDPWLRDALQPLTEAIEQLRATMENRLDSMDQISQSSAALVQRLERLRTEHRELGEQLTILRKIENTLYQAPSLAEPASRLAWPKAVAEGPHPPR